jgi:hypothetical protein
MTNSRSLSWSKEVSYCARMPQRFSVRVCDAEDLHRPVDNLCLLSLRGCHRSAKPVYDRPLPFFLNGGGGEGACRESQYRAATAVTVPGRSRFAFPGGLRREIPGIWLLVRRQRLRCRWLRKCSQFAYQMNECEYESQFEPEFRGLGVLGHG